jgi:hypothetical protein
MGRVALGVGDGMTGFSLSLSDTALSLSGSFLQMID